MTTVSPAGLIESLARHRLLLPEQLAEVTGGLAARFPAPQDLARELLQRDWLTAYQANQLLQGRGADLLLGSYVLLEKLGAGGMGTVFKAKNWKLGRDVALKVIRKERLDNADAVRRFQREIRIAAQLDHPNIVRALDADEVSGTHLLVMKLVEGIDLSRRVKQQGPLPVAEACEVARQAALGLQHAFERGLVHRDVKPHNLLFTHQPGPDGTRTVKVLDMGLARVGALEGDSEESAITAEGALMGTPDYIAPEQAVGSHTVDIRADLYSLGCTLYFLLTGRPPFPGGNLGAKLLCHKLEEPDPVERLRPDVPAAVAAVVRRLMAKSPQDRYQAPIEAAEALVSALTDVPQAAPPPLAAPVGPFQFEEARDTVTSASEAPGPPGRGPWMMVLGSAAVGLSILLGALVTLRALRGPVVLRNEKQGEPEPHPPPILPPFTAPPGGFARLFNGTNLDGWEAMQGRLEDWEVQKGLLVCKGGRPGLLTTTKFYRDLTLRLHWRASPGSNSGAYLRARTPGEHALEVDIIPREGDPKAVGNGAGDVWLFLAGRRRKIVPLAKAARPAGEWNACEITWIGDRITARLNDQLIQDLDGSRDTRLGGLSHGGPIGLQSLRGRVEFCNLFVKEHSPSTPRLLVAHPWGSTYRGLAFTPDGQTLAALTRSGQLHLFDLPSGEKRQSKQTQEKKQGKGAVIGHEVAIDPDGFTLATSGADGIHLWALPGLQKQKTLRIEGAVAQSLVFGPGGHFLYAGCSDGVVRRWGLKTGGPAEDFFKLPANGTIHLAQDGKHWAAHTMRNDAVWLDGKLIAAPTGHAGWAGASFSPDGRLLAVNRQPGEAHVFDTTTRERKLTLAGHSQLLPIQFAPDGRALATADKTGVIRLWDVRSGRKLVEFRARGAGPTAGPGRLAFSPDGRILAVSVFPRTGAKKKGGGKGEGSLQLWDVSAYSGPPRAGPWRALFNGKDRTGWHLSGKDRKPEEVFTVLPEEESALRIRADLGGGPAYLNTAAMFRYYHLRLEYKWPADAPATASQDLEYHLLGLAGNRIALRPGPGVGELAWWGPRRAFGGALREGALIKLPNAPKPPRLQDAHNPLGEWTRLDLVCLGGGSLLMLNGKRGLVAFVEQAGPDGTREPVTSGKIGFTSERGELLIRRMDIRSITEIPAELLGDAAAP